MLVFSRTLGCSLDKAWLSMSHWPPSGSGKADSSGLRGWSLAPMSDFWPSLLLSTTHFQPLSSSRCICHCHISHLWLQDWPGLALSQTLRTPEKSSEGRVSLISPLLPPWWPAMKEQTNGGQWGAPDGATMFSYISESLLSPQWASYFNSLNVTKDFSLFCLTVFSNGAQEMSRNKVRETEVLSEGSP